MPTAGRNADPAAPAASSAALSASVAARSGPAGSRPRVGIVVAGQGSLTPVEAYAALRDGYEPVFLVRSPAPDDEPPVDKSPDDEVPDTALTATMTALARRAEVCWLPPARRLSRPDLPAGLRGVTTFCADGVPIALELAAELGLPALGAGGGRSLYDKAAQRAALGPGLSPRFVALPHPCCATLTGPDPHAGCNRQEWARAANVLGLPAVLKPVHGQASRGVRRIATAADLMAAWKDLADLAAARTELAADADDCAATRGKAAEPEWLLEEFLAGHDRWPRAAYLSVESVVSDSRVRHVALTRKLPLVEPFRELGQYLLPADPREPDDDALLAAASDALARLRVTNAVTHTELTMTPDGPKVIEVNARLGGLVRELVGAGRGIDLARLAAAVAVGDRPDDAAVAMGDRPEYAYPAAESPPGAGLVFQYAPLAPVQPAVLRQVHGLDAVMSLAGVDKYLPHVAAGQLLPGGTETVTMGVVSGWCRDEDELAAVLTEVERLLTYEFLLGADGEPDAEDAEPACCDTRGRVMRSVR